MSVVGILSIAGAAESGWSSPSPLYHTMTLSVATAR